MNWTWIASILAAYVVGSIPFGVIIAHMRGVNIREQGSKNIGATNVGRVLGRRLGVLCFALDVLKGGAPVMVSGVAAGVLGRSVIELSQSDMLLWLSVAAAAVLGHMFSLFLRFAGGKGVATACGGLLCMWPVMTMPTVAAIIVWIMVAYASRIVSLGSILAAVSLPMWLALGVATSHRDAPFTALQHALPLLASIGALAVLVVFRHRANLNRLRRGEEPRIGGKPR